MMAPHPAVPVDIDGRVDGAEVGEGSATWLDPEASWPTAVCLPGRPEGSDSITWDLFQFYAILKPVICLNFGNCHTDK